jgi:two-component system sporulation sensor kinase B
VQRVKANAGPLGQALDNLIANAIESMPDGGPLRVASQLAGGGQQVEITIEDSGTGLPAWPDGTWPPMFYSTKAQGTGLGLLLTRRILAGYGGSLQMERRAGQPGTRAVIRLPVAA